ncbi:MAG: TetR/AcrR family transcriptional regulator [Pseudomonadales bacterium]|nr:TetR/AcrR family transcriptional regulator [Pseudomonadales bacterium]
MPVTARREREKQQRYEDIVDAAEIIFNENGFANTSMDEIARAAQLSRALLYVYFKDKAAIMRAVMLKAMQAMEARFANAFTAEEAGMKQIKGIGCAYYAFSVEESDYFDMLTELNTFPDPEEPDLVAEGMLRCRQNLDGMMVQALENGIKDGSLNPEHIGDPLITAYILQGSLHGVIMSTRKPKNPNVAQVDSEMLVKRAIDMMCYAMAA